jgi:hypothetical protein
MKQPRRPAETLNLGSAQWSQQVAAANWWSHGGMQEAEQRLSQHGGAASDLASTVQRRGVKRKGPSDQGLPSVVEQRCGYVYADDPATPTNRPSSWQPQLQSASAGEAGMNHASTASAEQSDWDPSRWAADPAVLQLVGKPQVSTTLHTSAGPPIFTAGVGLIFGASQEVCTGMQPQQQQQQQQQQPQQQWPQQQQQQQQPVASHLARQSSVPW